MTVYGEARGGHTAARCGTLRHAAALSGIDVGAPCRQQGQPDLIVEDFDGYPICDLPLRRRFVWSEASKRFRAVFYSTPRPAGGRRRRHHLLIRPANSQADEIRGSPTSTIVIRFTQADTSSNSEFINSNYEGK